METLIGHMAGRDDFSLETKRRLAARAGYRCSFPDCGVPTVGPSDETTSATTLSGEACHIAAAGSGPGARRFDPLMTANERKSIDNGIWLCSRHSQMIDADEHRFTVELLQHWKRVAEHRARLLQELGISGAVPGQALESLGLGHNVVEISGPGTENLLVGEALADSCVPAIWGEDAAHAVRDFVIEIVRNAFAHGGATKAVLEVAARTVSIYDDGAPFDATTLLQRADGSGGCAAIRALLDGVGDPVVISSSREQLRNLTAVALVRNPEDVPLYSSCSLTLTHEHVRGGEVNLQTVEHCELIYVVFPKYFSISDVFMALPSLESLRTQHKQLAFVLQQSSRLVRDELRKAVPEARQLVC
jgi:hypothetical protein